MKRPMRTLGIAFAICLTLVLCITVPIALATGDGISFRKPSVNTDSNAKLIGEADSKVQSTATGDSITISMCSNPVFQSGSSEGNLNIIVSEENDWPQIVEIYEDSSNTRIYKSDCIPVGYSIPDAKLAVSLPAGTYECTARFYAIDPDSGEQIGSAGAEIKITILS